MEITIKSAKTEIYDFNQYSCSPEKCFPLWGGEFLKPFVKIHIFTYSMCIVTVQGFLKNGQCHEVG